MSVQAESLRVELGEFVLGPLSLEFPTGSVTAIVGANGCGKTTLLRAVCGVQQLALGHVRVNGCTVHSMHEGKRAARMAMVVQRPTVPFGLSVRETIELGRLTLPHAPSAIDRALHETGLTELQHQSVATLSEGQRHRTAFARALAQRNPELHMVTIDEPTASLDPVWSVAMSALLPTWAAEGVAILVATHDLAFAAACCDRAVLLDRGAVVESGAIETVLTQEKLSMLFGTRFTTVHGLTAIPVPMPWWPGRTTMGAK